MTDDKKQSFRFGSRTTPLQIPAVIVEHMRKKWEILEEEEAGDTVPANVIIYEDSPELGLAEISFKSEIEPPEKAIVQISGTGQCLSPQLHYLGRQH